MSQGVLSLILLRQFLNAGARLAGILWRSQPGRGWPILRAFLDVLERISQDAHPETVSPALKVLLEEIEARCPGVTDAVSRSRDPRGMPNRDSVRPATEATTQEVNDRTEGQGCDP